MEITYRFLDTTSNSDISQWMELYSVCFPDEITNKFWAYLNANPFYRETKPLIFVAQNEGKIVGSLTALPSPIAEYREGRKISYNSLAMFKGMVHPDYQNKGIFGHLSKNFIETAKSEGYDLVFGIWNNPYSHKKSIETGFHDVAGMRWSRLFLSSENVFNSYIYSLHIPSAIKNILASAVSKGYSLLIPRSDHTYHVRSGDIAECIKEIENFFTSFKPEGSIYGGRSAAFLHWKFNRDDVCFRCFTIWEAETLLGYAIVLLKKGRKIAYVVDICFLKEQNQLISGLLSEINCYLKGIQYRELWMYMVENNTPLSKFFSLRHGFLRRSLKNRKLEKPRLLVYALDPSIISSSLLEKNNWKLQPVDVLLFLQ